MINSRGEGFHFLPGGGGPAVALQVSSFYGFNRRVLSPPPHAGVFFFFFLNYETNFLFAPNYCKIKLIFIFICYISTQLVFKKNINMSTKLFL